MSIDFPFFRFTMMGCFVVIIVAICQPALALDKCPSRGSPSNAGGPDVCLSPDPPIPTPPPPPPSPPQPPGAQPSPGPTPPPKAK
jgi:hypothetical protein